jgi:hypothetical protein
MALGGDIVAGADVGVDPDAEATTAAARLAGRSRSVP